MPLKRGTSNKTFRYNVREMAHRGYPINQAVAAAYTAKRHGGWHGSRRKTGRRIKPGIYWHKLPEGKRKIKGRYHLSPAHRRAISKGLRRHHRKRRNYRTYSRRRTLSPTHRRKISAGLRKYHHRRKRR